MISVNAAQAAIALSVTTKQNLGIDGGNDSSRSLESHWAKGKGERTLIYLLHLHACQGNLPCFPSLTWILSANSHHHSFLSSLQNSQNLLWKYRLSRSNCLLGFLPGATRCVRIIHQPAHPHTPTPPAQETAFDIYEYNIFLVLVVLNNNGDLYQWLEWIHPIEQR